MIWWRQMTPKWCDGLASSSLKMTIYDGFMMMTTTPLIILNIKWRWGWRQTSLKKKWRRHDDLAVTVNDAAPCSVLCVMPDKISFKTFNISVSHSSGLLVRVCLYVWFQHLAFPYQGLNGLKTFWNGKEVNLSISTMSTYIDRV